MRKWILPLLFAGGLCVGAASAQVSQESVNVQNFVPTGACTTSPLVKVSNVGTYQCIASVWTKVGPNSSSGGGTVTSVTVGTLPSFLGLAIPTNTTTPVLNFTASLIPNTALANSATTVNGQSCVLGGACTIAAGSVASVFGRTGVVIATTGDYTAAQVGADAAGAAAAAQAASDPVGSATTALNTAVAHTINGKALSTNPVLGATDVGAVPTGGNAGTATALAATPTLCSTGQAPTGVLANGNATGCAAVQTGVTSEVIGGTSSYNQTQVTSTFDSFNSIVPVWPAANGTGIQVAFSNVWNVGELAGPPMALTCSVESPIGNIRPCTVGGSNTVQVGPGALVVFDPLAVDVTKGVVFNVRLHGLRTAGNTVALPDNHTFALVSGTSLTPNTTSRTGGFYDGIELGTTRSLSDGVANGTTTFTSATANFGLLTSAASDVGQLLTVEGMTYTINSVTNATTVVLSGSPATGTTLAFTVAQADKTLSGTIATGGNVGPAPFAIIGQVGSPIKSAVLPGDSITYGIGANLAIGSWAVQALNQSGVSAGLATQVATSIPFVNPSMQGDTVASLIVNHPVRYAFLPKAKYALGMIGINDLTASASAATLEANLVTLWTQESLRGTKPYYGTILPHNASTDGWLTLANQSVLNSANETNRVAVNTWMRDGAPVSSTTGLPVAVGSATATTNRCPFYVAGVAQVNPTSGVATASGPGVHPATGLFELANVVETAQNSGNWQVDAGNRTVTDAAMTAASTTLTSATATFTSADVGHVVFVAGAFTTANERNTIESVTNATTVVMLFAANNTVTGATATIDGQPLSNLINNGDGLHPGQGGHKLLGAAAGLTVATWQ